MTENHPPPVFDPTQGPSAAWRLLSNPALNPADLPRIAAAFPDLAPTVAAHPRLTPDAAAWLNAMRRPDVDAVLTARGYRPTPPAVASPPTVFAAGGAPSEAAPAFSGYAPPPMGGPPVGSPPTTPTRRWPRRRAALLTIGAAVLVAAVVAVVALTGLPNNDGRIDRALMPDITEQPAVGNPIDSRDVLDGDFQITKFSLFGLLDHDTGLVLGYTYSDGRWSDSYDATYAAGRQEGERHVAIGAPEGAYDKLCFGDFSHGYTEGGVDYYSEVWCDGYRDGYEGTADRLLEMLSGASAALAAFDFETGETKWQLNLLEAADIDAEDWLSILLDWTEASQDIFSGLVGEPMAVPDGRGNALVVIGGHIMTVDGGGTVVSTAEFDGSYVECSQGFVVITTRGGADVEAYRTTDLETELWSADAPDTALRMGGPVVVHEPSSTFWAPTADGFVDVPTGEGIGFGDDLDKANYYAVPLRPDLVVLRGDLGKDRLARIDPKNGEEMWRANNVSPYLPQMTSDYILLEDNSGGGTARIIAIDIADGEEAWVANTGAIAAVSEDRVLSKVDQEGKHELVAFNATKGTELYRVKIDEFANPQMGRRVLYHTPDMVSGAVDGVTRVQAVSLQDGKVLWEVSADGMPPYSVGLLYGGQGRAWLLSPDSSDGGQSASVFSAATWEMMVPLRQ